MKKMFDLAQILRDPADTFSVSRFLKRRMLVIFSLLAISVFFIIFFNEGKTESAVFYPESCLGGWETPQLAQGKSEIEGTVNFNETNSARLFNSLAEVYCGGFMGEVPENSKPEKAILKLGLAVRKITFPASITPELVPEDVFESSSSLEILLPVSPETTPELESLPLLVPSVSESPVLSPDGNVPILLEEPLSFLMRKILRIAHAEDEAPQESILTPDQAMPSESGAESPLVSSSSESISELGASFEPEPLPEASSTPDVLIEEIASSSQELFTPEPLRNDILEVFYSFDGADWFSLGKIDLFAVESSSFEIAGFDWNKLPLLQVKVAPLPNELSDSEILLEHVALEVFYIKDDETSLDLEAINEKPDFSVLAVKSINTVSKDSVAIFSMDASSTPSLYLIPLNDPDRSQKIVSGNDLGLISPVGVKNNFIFWLSSDASLMALAVDSGKYFKGKLVLDLIEEKEKVFSLKNFPAEIIYRSGAFYFRDLEHGEVFPDDDFDLRKSFFDKFLRSLPQAREDIVQLNLSENHEAVIEASE